LESLHRNLSVVVPMENVMLKIENIIVYRSWDWFFLTSKSEALNGSYYKNKKQNNMIFV
jgi:hypothetical protein